MTKALSEEDLKVLVVASWLRDHGIASTELRFEESFSLTVGKGVHRTPARVGARADILVRRADINLLVIETKAPDEDLTDDDREQAISYARLVTTGNLIPFAVVTNGRETRIYDTITKAEIAGAVVPLTHPYVKNGYIATTEDLAIRAEALEVFLGLCPGNLLAFCRSQVDYRMRALRSEEATSGRKYIPSFYIERTSASQRLRDLLLTQSVVLVVGRPQVGKTNFMCHEVERRLDTNEPCLFFTAVGMAGGIFDELAADLSWAHTQASSFQALVSRLSRVARTVGHRITIFVDGLNEGGVEVLRRVERDCARLGATDLRFIVSLTSFAAQRLLRDSVGNQNALALAANVPDRGIDLLQHEPALAEVTWSVVTISSYSDEERRDAYARYAAGFNVTVDDDHVATADPLLLRVAMERSAGGKLARELSEPELLEAAIEQKVRRSGMSPLEGAAFVASVAEVMFEYGAPTPLRHLRAQFSMLGTLVAPSSMVEAALLTNAHDAQRGQSADFYFSRERDYAIAKCRGWLTGCVSEFLAHEYKLASRHDSGVDALRWFLRQPAPLAEAVGGGINEYDVGLRLLLIEASVALAQTLIRPAGFHRRGAKERRLEELLPWLEAVTQQSNEDPDMLVRAEGAKLVAFIGDSEWLTRALEDERGFLERLLEVDFVVPFELGGPGQVVLQAFQDWAQQEAMEYGLPDPSEASVVSSLEAIAKSNRDCAGAAAKLVAYLAPELGLKLIAASTSVPLFGGGDQWCRAASAAATLAAETLSDYYFGDMCPGYLNVLQDEPDEHWAEYRRMAALIQPVAQSLIGRPGGKALRQLLEGIKPEPATPMVGDILVHAWGHERMNIDFYQVVQYSLPYVYLRRIGCEAIRSAPGTNVVQPRKDDFLDWCDGNNKRSSEPRRYRLCKSLPGASYCVKIHKSPRSLAILWKGQPVYSSSADVGH